MNLIEKFDEADKIVDPCNITDVSGLSKEEKMKQIMLHYHSILNLLGEDVQREGLIKTPYRVAKAMQFLTRGYEQSPEDIIRSAMFREDYQQMVIVKDIDFYSMCEHHMLPFFGKAHVAYIPNKYITGWSKIRSEERRVGNEC